MAVGSRRYSHVKCYDKARAADPKLRELEIVYPDEFVTCKYCKKKINKKDTNYKAINKKFAHIECIEKEKTRERTDEEKFYDYVIDLFQIEEDFVPLRIKKQAQTFVKDYNYSYSGMLKALKYFYEVKRADLSKANNGIGIIPYIYQDAYNYYFSLWLANQKNNVNLMDYIPSEIEITIPSPKRKINKKKRFTFLDEDETNE